MLHFKNGINKCIKVFHRKLRPILRRSFQTAITAHVCEPDRAPLTCLSLSCSILARRFLSGGDRYFCVSNFFSSSMVWSLEKRTWPPFLLCKGRWMNGVHSRGFPVERSHRMHRVWNTWNKTKYLFLAATNVPAVEKEATAYKPSCCHLTWNELTKHASARQKHGTFVLCYIRPTDGIFTHIHAFELLRRVNFIHMKI